MSDVNSIKPDLYVRDTSSYRPATFEETLHAARRALAERFRPGRSLRSPELVQEYLRFALASKEHEVFCLIGLDARHRLLGLVELFRGTVDGAQVHPREVVKESLRLNAVSVIIAHNHPLCCFGNCHPLKSRVELQGLPAQRTMTRRARRQGNPRWRGRAAARSLTACAAACVVSRAGNVA